MLTVVIPVRNSEATVSEQLDALSNQSFEGQWEVVIADNGSTDRSVHIAQAHAGLSGRLRVIDASQRPGAAHARNKAVHAAKGDAICFCDGDDVASPQWLATLAAGLEVHDLVCGPYEVHALNPRWLADTRGDQRLTEPQRYGPVTLFPGGCFGITRKSFELVGGFDPEYRGHEEHELALRLHVAGINAVHFPEAVMHYRYRQGRAELFQQALHYGQSHPALASAARQYGLPTPSRFEVRPWIWLLANLHRLASFSGRRKWLWVVGCRVGRLRGSIRHRTVFL